MATTVEVTQETWATQVMQSKVPVLVDFWAPWCRPCTQLAPTLEEIAADYEGRIIVAKVNVDEQRALAAVWQIMSIPALMVFQDGNKVDEMIGAADKKAITDRLDAVLG